MTSVEMRAGSDDRSRPKMAASALAWWLKSTVFVSQGLGTVVISSKIFPETYALVFDRGPDEQVECLNPQKYRSDYIVVGK